MTKISRRSILGQTAAAGLVGVLSKGGSGSQSPKGIIKKGRLKQFAFRWSYSKIAFPEFCRADSEIGLTAIDLLSEEEWPIARENGLICSMAWAPKEIKIDTGLNVKANHDAIIRTLERLIPSAAKSNVPNVIAFFGNRRGVSDAEGKENCIVGLNRIRTVAEDHGVNVCVELLNSKINHKDYQGDHTAFGVEIVKAVDNFNSERSVIALVILMVDLAIQEFNAHVYAVIFSYFPDAIETNDAILFSFGITYAASIAEESDDIWQ